MTTPDKCPFCGSSNVIPGQVRAFRGPYGFKPDDTKSGTFTFRSVFAFEFGPVATFCPHCSMVWSKADPKDAAAFIRHFGTEALQAKFHAGEEASPVNGTKEL